MENYFELRQLRVNENNIKKLNGKLDRIKAIKGTYK